MKKKNFDFEKLSVAKIVSNGLEFDSIEEEAGTSVYLTRDQTGNPTFLLEVEKSPSAPTPIELENIKCIPECEAYVRSDQQNYVRLFYAVTYTGIDVNMRNLFFEIFRYLPKLLKSHRTSLSVHKEVTTIMELFSEELRDKRKSILGVWGELFLISVSGDPAKMISGWHSSTSALYDFDLGGAAIECKVSSKGIRIHTFSHSQLSALLDRDVFIVSIMTSEAPDGISIKDLKNEIISRVKDDRLCLKLITMVGRLLGPQEYSRSEINFDQIMARDSLRVYDTKSVPQIQGPIPNGVTKLKYDSNLELISSLPPDSISFLK